MGLVWVLWGTAWLVGESLPHGTAWNIYWMFTPGAPRAQRRGFGVGDEEIESADYVPAGRLCRMEGAARAQRVIGATIAMVTAALLAALVVRARAQGTERVAPALFGVFSALDLSSPA